MESLLVSGAQSNRELCIAAKKEEGRLAELKNKQQYLKSDTSTERQFQGSYEDTQKSAGSGTKTKLFWRQEPLICCLCDSPHHPARDCHKHKTESQGRTSQKVTQVPKWAKIISTRYYTFKQKQSSCVEVKVEGIPVTGLIPYSKKLWRIWQMPFNSPKF